MNKQDILNQIEWHLEETEGENASGTFGRGYKEGCYHCEALIEQLDEPQKVKIPVCVAKWISECQELNLDLSDLLAPGVFDSTFAFNTKEWLRQDKQQNYDILARAWLDGYEVEKEPKWVVKSSQINGMYFRGVAGVSTDGDFSYQWSEPKGCVKFTDLKKAETVATLVDGSVEEV